MKVKRKRTISFSLSPPTLFFLFARCLQRIKRRLPPLHCRAPLSIFHWQIAEIILGSCLSLDPGLNVLGTGASSISGSNLWNYLPPAAQFSSQQKFSRLNFRFSFISWPFKWFVDHNYTQLTFSVTSRCQLLYISDALMSNLCNFWIMVCILMHTTDIYFFHKQYLNI